MAATSWLKSRLLQSVARRSRISDRLFAACINNNLFDSVGAISVAAQKITYATKSGRSHEYDVLVVGGGIVGLAVARELIIRHPQLTYGVVEKENRLGAHQSGHNSGVIHASVYYKPGSLKAQLCLQGLYLTYKYCDEHNIPYKKCGKLIVATEPHELPLLEELYRRGKLNEVPDLHYVEKEEIKNYEPYCKGLRALRSPHTGIVDWGIITQSYGTDFQNKGGVIHLNFDVQGFDFIKEGKEGQVGGNKYPVRIRSSKGQEVRCRYAVVCGGLYADRLAVLSGCNENPRIVPFRGEYLLLKPEKSYLCRGNIYPVPNPKFPFLGVHFTPRMNGDIWLGPNAVLAFKREGYRPMDVSLYDIAEVLSFRGFQKLALKNITYGMDELFRSVFLSKQVEQLAKFIPELTVNDVIRGPSGVRAQAMDANGNLVDDFIFDGGSGSLGKRLLHVRNAPSPAATSSLAIAKYIADEVKNRFQL